MHSTSESSPTAIEPTCSLGAHFFGHHTRVAALGSGHIRYIDEGSGPVVLLLHGAPFTSLGFTRLIRRLRSKHRVIAPDLPGFGTSTAAPSFGHRLTDYAAFVEEFCAALRLEGVHLYLNDSSGCIGFHASPALLPRLSGVVIASTVALPLERSRQLVRIMLRHVVGSRFSRWLNRKYNWLARLVASQGTSLGAWERRVLAEQFPTPQSRDAIIDVFRQMADDDSFMVEAARRCRQSFAALPVLILYGDEDPMCRLGAAEHYHRELPQARVRILRGHHHFPILSGPDVVGDAIENWVRDISPRQAVMPSANALEVAS